MKTWRLKKGEERRFRSGHPWVYSNELQASPKDTAPGQAVELCLPGGEFLAFGAGNPNSLIAFRCFSRKESDRENLFSVSFFQKAFQKNLAMRKALGLHHGSFRLCFGEADDLPGCVVDAYLVNQKEWILVLQVHAAAIEAHLEPLLGGLRAAWSAEGLDTQPTRILIRRDLAVRKLEGLEVLDPQWAEEPNSERLEKNTSDYQEVKIGVQSATSGFAGYSKEKQKNALTELWVDLWDGQKTGFFLDQRRTIQQFMHLMRPWMRQRFQGDTVRDVGPLRVLDLFAYVGQWSVAFIETLAEERMEVKSEIHPVDVSGSAIAFAQKNLKSAVEKFGHEKQVKIFPHELDILKSPQSLPEGNFDVIISDPPALIKNKKSIEAGRHEYVQLHTEVLKKVKSGGLVICCSCSFHLSKEDFERTLQQAEKRSGRRVYWLENGRASWDHPRLMAFPEGDYLKSRIGWVE